MTSQGSANLNDRNAKRLSALQNPSHMSWNHVTSLKAALSGRPEQPGRIGETSHETIKDRGDNSINHWGVDYNGSDHCDR
jgi:hypothetical protein